MKRALLSLSLLLFLGLALGGCGGAYVTPSRGIDADIQAAHGAGSASLVSPLNFRN